MEVANPQEAIPASLPAPCKTCGAPIYRDRWARCPLGKKGWCDPDRSRVWSAAVVLAPIALYVVIASLWVLAAVCCPVGWIGY